MRYLTANHGQPSDHATLAPIVILWYTAPAIRFKRHVTDYRTPIHGKATPFPLEHQREALADAD